MALDSAKFTILINGKQLSQDRYNCINSVNIFQTVDGSSTANIKISDPNFVYINDNIFLEEVHIKVIIDWYGNPTRTTFEGYISAIKASFPSSGLPVLDITCMDSTHRMNRKKRSKTYKKKTSKSVVKQIAKRYGLKPHFTKGWKSVKQESITQSNQTDIDFLTNLASSESYPFAVYVIGKNLYYVRKGIPNSKVSVTLHYKEYPFTIIEYNPTIAQEEVKKIQKYKPSKKKDKTKKKSGSTKKIKSSKKTKKSGSSKKTSTKGSTKNTKKKTYNPKTKKWS